MLNIVINGNEIGGIENILPIGYTKLITWYLYLDDRYLKNILNSLHSHSYFAKSNV